MPDDTRSIARKIRDALIIELEKVQYQSEPAFIEVTKTTRGEFEGYPSVRVLPGNIENEATGMGETERTVNFTALLHIEVASEKDKKADPLGDAIDSMYDLTEAMIDQLDTADINNRLDENEEGLDTLKISTSVVDWDFFAGAPGTILLCAVRVAVSYSKDLQFDS